MVKAFVFPLVVLYAVKFLLAMYFLFLIYDDVEYVFLTCLFIDVLFTL